MYLSQKICRNSKLLDYAASSEDIARFDAMNKAGKIRAGSSMYTHQLFGTHVVENALSILTVMATLHNSQKQLRSVVLKVKSPKSGIVR